MTTVSGIIGMLSLMAGIIDPSKKKECNATKNKYQEQILYHYCRDFHKTDAIQNLDLGYLKAFKNILIFFNWGEKRLCN